MGGRKILSANELAERNQKHEERMHVLDSGQMLLQYQITTEMSSNIDSKIPISSSSLNVTGNIKSRALQKAAVLTPLQSLQMLFCSQCISVCGATRDEPLKLQVEELSGSIRFSCNSPSLPLEPFSSLSQVKASPRTAQAGPLDELKLSFASRERKELLRQICQCFAA